VFFRVGLCPPTLRCNASNSDRYETGVRLDEEGIRPKRGKRWIHTTVKSILARSAA